MRGAAIQSCRMSVDGIDCIIQEPKPFNRKWYSHKSNGSGLRYEIGISIESSSICWVYGPFPCGARNDQSIFNEKLRHQLSEGERVIADKGYRGERIQDLQMFPDPLGKRIRARHETLNSRIKQFKIVGSVFRHDLKLHGICFHAVTQVVQVSFSCGQELFKA